MYTLHYQIEFHSDWHCGSGLSSGAELDARVIRDADGLPFLPGRTVKGLLRDAVLVLFPEQQKTEAFKRTFGISADKDDRVAAHTFFSNARMFAEERKAILEEHGLLSHLFKAVSRTAIDEHGIALEHSLRRMEVVVPCQLEGEILHVEAEMVDVLADAMAYIKRLGTGRHRGLGRCTLSVTKKEEER